MIAVVNQLNRMQDSLPTSGRPTRAGVTLVEVLMSMMILAIGVLSLASLLPIGILSSARATQLTHATTLKYNADTAIDLFPLLVHDPDSDGNLREHNGEKYLVDPLGHVRGLRVVHPSEDLNGNGNLDANEDANGNGKLDAGVTRYPGLQVFQTEADALHLVGSPDSWSRVVSANSVNTTNSQVTIYDNVDLDAVSSHLIAGFPARIHLIDPFGMSTAHRDVYSAVPGPDGGGVVSWQAPISNITATRASQVYIETQDLRYSWLLTVKKHGLANDPPGTAVVDVAVFFRRTADALNESAGTVDFHPLNAQARPATANDPNATLHPVPTYYRNGSYVFDPINFEWYEIQESEVTHGGGGLTVRFDRPVVSQMSSYVLFRGVIAVFRLGTKVP